jgi:hypothetical protein
MKKLTKIIIGIIVLIIVAVLVYVVFFKKAQAPQDINPNQSIPSSWVTYNDSVSGISLKAPAGLTVATSSTGLSLVFATTTPYVHTHLLHELRIDIATPAVDCISTNSDSVSSSTPAAINGVDFERETWSGVGLGNLYQGIDYTVVRNGLCYRVGLFTHSTNGEGFYSNDPVQIKKIDALQAMDMRAMLALFDQIAGTIKFAK